MFVISHALVVFGGRLDLDSVSRYHAVAESFQKLEEVFEMGDPSVGDGFPRDVVEVVLDDFGDEVDDSLYLLAGGERVVLAESEQVNDGLREDDLADLKVDLLIFEDLYFLYPPPDAHILEDVDGDVNDVRLARALVPLHTFIHKNNYRQNNLYRMNSGFRFFRFCQGSSAFRAFRVDLRPVLDAFSVEKVFALCVDGSASFFVPGQTDRANLLALDVFSDVIEFVGFPAV